MSETAAAERTGPPGGGSSGALITYRYLRFGILGAVVLLAVSILWEWVETGPRCLQGSVSAYYYTPVRSVFVGTLMAVGLCLIVVRGRTFLEDLLLNVGGMLAPIVALVPTSGEGSCASIRQSDPPTVGQGEEKELADWVVANIQNNVGALALTGLLAMGGLVLYFGRRGRSAVSRTNTDWRVTVSLTVTTVLVAVGALLFWTTDVFERHAHYIAAIAMFVCFGGVVLLNDWLTPRSARKQWYRLIWVLMAASGVVAIGLALADFRHTVFVLEAVEIVLFACFWVLQSVERWFEPPPAMAARAVVAA